jgi:quercetin dioxygenase-like cupin family protein
VGVNRLVNMAQTTVLLSAHTPADQFRPGFSRRIIQTSQLMTVVLDIDNGPWDAPDPFHSHPHEQITYIAEGEVLFVTEGAEGGETRKLVAGDLFAVPSGIPHSIQLLSQRARRIDTFHPIREDFLTK